MEINSLSSGNVTKLAVPRHHPEKKNLLLNTKLAQNYEFKKHQKKGCFRFARHKHGVLEKLEKWIQRSRRLDIDKLKQTGKRKEEAKLI